MKAYRSSDDFFHSEGFIHREGATPVVTFETPASAVSINFTRSNDALISVARSPYGGFISDQDLSEKQVSDLVKNVLQWASKEGIPQIIIKCCPHVYSPSQLEVIEAALLRMDFKILYKDVTQVFTIDDTTLNLNINRKRMLTKAQQQQLIFQQLSPSYLDEVYVLFKVTRERKGYPVNMTLQDLKNAFSQFPDIYLLFGILDQQEVVAAAVCIKVTSDIMYYFFPGDDEAYKKYSPGTMLITSIYNYCKQHHYGLFDLGISTDRGVLNADLYRFKKSFGTRDSIKLTFQKTL